MRTFCYTDGKPAQENDPVKFQLSFGYEGTRKMTGTGKIKKLDQMYGQVSIDISPRKFMEDMGRFGTRETSIFTCHAIFDKVENGNFKYIIAKPSTQWSLEVLCDFNDWCLKDEV